MKQWFKELGDLFRPKLESFLTWQWVKRFLYWLVVSAGTVSECVFLMASIWVSVNATVHPLTQKLLGGGNIGEARTVTLSQLSVSAFTALPEIILGLAAVTTYGHIKFYCLHRKRSSLVWAILFGLPTVVFAGLTLWTLASSAVHIDYTMPDFLVATRVLAGYAYGFLSMLYVLIGEPDNADYVTGLKGEIDTLDQEIESLKAGFEVEIDRLKTTFASDITRLRNESKVILEEKQSEIDQFQNLLKTQNEQVKRLAERASSLVSQGLENYPKVVEELVNKGVKTVHIDILSDLTGISKRRIASAKNLQRHSRNKDLIMVNSAIEWLQKQPLPEPSIVVKEEDETPETNHSAKIIEFHLPNVYPQNGA